MAPFSIFKFRLVRYKLVAPMLYACRHGRQNSSSSDVLYSLLRRGLVTEVFPNNAFINSPGTSCAYAGFDATADSLHIGNLLVICALLHWQRAGYKTVIVIGDVTTEIGDPSGHKNDREVLSRDVINQNSSSIESCLLRVFENHEKYIYPKVKKKRKFLELSIHRNSEWYHSIKAVDFFTAVGRNIRIGDMLSRKSVKSRMENESGMNYSEFSYQVFQSYDWLHLFKNHNCRFQFGGKDQLGNITSGCSLVSASQYQQVYGALMPLMQSESGDKFGKSAGNAVYISPERTSPFDFYQFFIRIPDTQVEKYLKLYTFLSLDEVEDVLQKHMKNPDNRSGQKRIATEVTLLIHGEQGLNIAETATKVLFHSDLQSLEKLNINDLKHVFPDSTVTEVPFDTGITILDLTLKAGCFLKEEDARRIIHGGGMYLNFERITSPEVVVFPEKHILANSTSLIRIGKKNYYLVLWK